LITGLKFHEKAVLDNPQVWEGVRTLAGLIARDANNETSAKIGITFVDQGSGSDRRVLIAPTGAAAIPLEFGHQGVPAKRPVKKTIDRYRVG
jgi:hypothetical protein